MDIGKPDTQAKPPRAKKVPAKPAVPTDQEGPASASGAHHSHSQPRGKPSGYNKGRGQFTYQGEKYDVAEMSRKIREKVDRIVVTALARLEDEIEEMPLRMLPITIGILLDKRAGLAMPGNVVTNNNVLVLNGLSRGEALAFLKGEAAGDRFPSQSSPILNGAPTLAPDALAIDLEPAGASKGIKDTDTAKDCP